MQIHTTPQVGKMRGKEVSGKEGRREGGKEGRREEKKKKGRERKIYLKRHHLRGYRKDWW